MQIRAGNSVRPAMPYQQQICSILLPLLFV